MSIQNILVKLSNTITLVAERCLIFYPTNKNTRLPMNIVYAFTLLFCGMTIMSYDYVEQLDVNKSINKSNLSSGFMFNLNTTELTEEPVVIEKPHYLIEDRNIRLGVGLLVAYLMISFLYSNTLHTKLKEFDNTAIMKNAVKDDTDGKSNTSI
jgi:hypothetical protein